MSTPLAGLLLALVSAWAGPALSADGGSEQAGKATAATAAAVDAAQEHGPLVNISPAKAQRLDTKAKRVVRRPKVPFDKPDEAQAFYANKRTGPLITRGPNVTTARPLDPAQYLPALQHMRGMTVINSSASRSGSSRFIRADQATAGAALSGWTNLGPANQGGRTRTLLIDPATPTTLYAGAVAGGVWKSTDGGANWSTGTDLGMSNLAVATLAFEPRNTSTLYAGTGEGVGNFDAVRGAGIFKSADAGATWAQLPSTNNTNFSYTQKVIVSPRKVSRVYAATRTGLWRSLDSGATWAVVSGVSASNGCTDMAMQEKRAVGFLFVSCGRTSGQGTVYRVLDSDTGTGTAVLSLAGQGRSSIAVAPSNESYVYIVASQRSAGAGPGQYGLHGVYRSTTNGAAGSFTTQLQGNVAPANTAQKINQLLLSNPVIALLTECGYGDSSYANQGWYDNVVAVDPMDAERVWVGGVDLWRSDDGGVSWGTAGYWWFDKGTDPEYHHADQHGIVFHPGYNGSSNKVMFSSHDGGVDRIDNARAPVNRTLEQLCGAPVAGGSSWIDRNNGYVTTQFYHGTAYPDGSRYFGGLQDNGTKRGTSPSLAWTTLTGGDGGYVAVDTQGDANAANDVLFAEYTGNSLQKSVDGGANFADANGGITGSGFLFITPFAMNQGSKTQLWIGGFDIWRTTDQAASWSRATGAGNTCGSGSISAIATHPANGNRVLVGMSDGCFHYHHGALSAPSTGAWPGGGFIASGYISSMAWDPNNVDVAYATVAIFGGNTVLKSIDGGLSWAPVMGTGLTALPQIPAHTVVVNPANSSEVFVGTDLGVFTSVDGGANWYRENTSFANVVVEHLEISATVPRRLFAFTHGRGAWVTNLATSGAP